MSESEVADYDRFLAVRADYIARERVASETVERILVAGSAAALGLTVTFIEKIAAQPAVSTKWYLAAGWILLLLSLSTSILTYVLRSLAYKKAREAIDSEVDKGNEKLAEIDFAEVKKLNNRLATLLYVRLVTLVAGVCALVYFAFANVSFRAN